jgi:lactoylglutathione lyase/glyoxylase I family protein
MFTRLAHVCLHVRDLARSAEFYTRLGFTPRFRFTRAGAPFGIYFEVGPGSYVEMFEDRSLEVPVNTGIVHFCLESDNLDGTVATLRQRGIPFTEKKLGCDNTWQIWLRDPDGNPFEVHQYTDQSLQHVGGTVEADW